jgi:hypothetical protein
MDFNTLNNNLNEYNLVKECIKFVGKETIEEQYERIKDKIEEAEPYKTEYFSYEFLDKYYKKIDLYQATVHLDSIIKNSGLNKKDFIKEYEPFLEKLFEDTVDLCNLCLKNLADEICEDCNNIYCSECVEFKDMFSESPDDCGYCEYTFFEIFKIENACDGLIDEILKEKIKKKEEQKRKKQKKKEEQKIKKNEKKERNKRIITNMLKNFKKEKIKTYIKNKYYINLNKSKKDMIDNISDKYEPNEIMDIFDY